MARFIFGMMLAAFIAALLAAGLMIALAPKAHATWKPEYANSSPEVQAWYSQAELTAEARKRFGFNKCCDHADVVRTQFRVNRTTRGDEWYYLADGVWKLIPADIIHLDKSAPDNQPTLFVYQGRETCFFPGASGI